MRSKNVTITKLFKMCLETNNQELQTLNRSSPVGSGNEGREQTIEEAW